MQKELKKHSLVTRANSFGPALQGVRIFAEHNGYWHLLFALLPIVLGYVFHISRIEWLFVVFAIGSVITSEALNTALEMHIDMTNPEYHSSARDTKDVAAGAVLITSVMAFVVGLIIFLPKILGVL